MNNDLSVVCIVHLTIIYDDDDDDDDDDDGGNNNDDDDSKKTVYNIIVFLFGFAILATTQEQLVYI